MASNALKPGMLLHVLQCPGQPSQQRLIQPSLSVASRLRNPTINKVNRQVKDREKLFGIYVPNKRLESTMERDLQINKKKSQQKNEIFRNLSVGKSFKNLTISSDNENLGRLTYTAGKHVNSYPVKQVI